MKGTNLIDVSNLEILMNVPKTVKPTGENYLLFKTLNIYNNKDKVFSMGDLIAIEEIDKAYANETYFVRIINRYIELIFKRGFELKGPSKKSLDFIKKRFKEIEAHSGKPVSELLEVFTHDAIKYSNGFLFKYRSSKYKVSGRPWKRGESTIDPIVSLIPLHVKDSGVELKLLNSKTVIKKFIIKRTDGVMLGCRPDDVIHVKTYAGAGDIFGTPMVSTVIPDIKALRKMEENVELLVFLYTIPLFHVQVGDDNKPAERPDIDNMQTQINEAPVNGMLVTGHRIKVTAVNAKDAAVDVSQYLDHFKKRIISGLGSSLVGLGEGDTTNRSTSLTVDKITQDVARYFQKKVEDFINFYLIKELLYEGGFNPSDEKNDVKISFPEIDIDVLIALQNHHVNLFNNNAVTYPELRSLLDEQPLTASEMKLLKSQLFPNQKGNAAENTSENKTQPENQHGKKTSPSQPINK